MSDGLCLSLIIQKPHFLERPCKCVYIHTGPQLCVSINGSIHVPCIHPVPFPTGLILSLCMKRDGSAAVIGKGSGLHILTPPSQSPSSSFHFWGVFHKLPGTVRTLHCHNSQGPSPNPDFSQPCATWKTFPHSLAHDNQPPFLRGGKRDDPAFSSSPFPILAAPCDDLFPPPHGTRQG